eukprot:TRINITY_DN18994_c0_g1_i1.p2 TRINITY_DN18994_c0_g1~~TRINITY_DN18994_c0_g1_i1.p2  ORF type:complete len:454 (+),score=83.59 TRINITY_DN18994_c0_g1_i1:1845-3206(+)
MGEPFGPVLGPTGVHQLVSTFWEYHNTGGLDIYSEGLYYLCSKYVKRHRTGAKRQKRNRRGSLRESGPGALESEYWTDRPSISLRDRLRSLLEDPTSSRAAAVLSAFLFAIVVAATAAICMETVPRWNPDVFPSYKTLWFTLDALVTAFFTLELALRFAVAERKLRFFLNFFNFIDLLSIIPFYVELGLDSRHQSFRVVRVVRLFRVFRVLKLARTSGTSGLVLGRVLRMSAPALTIPAFFLILGMVIISAALYFAEQGDYDEAQAKYLISDSDCEARPKYLLGKVKCPKIESNFLSIPDTMWWAITTMTTVGYGDLVPRTRWGKAIASVGMFVGIVFLAMPLTIVGGNFAKVIAEMLEERKVAKREALEEEVDRQRDELDCRLRAHHLNTEMIDLQLNEVCSKLRAILPALQASNAKLARHVDHFLELTRDIRLYAGEGDDALTRLMKETQL